MFRKLLGSGTPTDEVKTDTDVLRPDSTLNLALEMARTYSKERGEKEVSVEALFAALAQFPGPVQDLVYKLGLTHVDLRDAYVPKGVGTIEAQSGKKKGCGCGKK